MTKYFINGHGLRPVATRDLPIGAEQWKWQKEIRVRLKQLQQFTERKLGLTWFRRKLIKIYFALPLRLQYRLARFGMRSVVRKKTAQLQQLLPH
jgi:hypothetical protein